ERLSARGAHHLGDGADDQRNVGDAATAGGDGDRSAGPQPRSEPDALELGAHAARDVVNVIAGQVLSNAEEARQGQLRVVGHRPAVYVAIRVGWPRMGVR